MCYQILVRAAAIFPNFPKWYLAFTLFTGIASSSFLYCFAFLARFHLGFLALSLSLRHCALLFSLLFWPLLMSQILRSASSSGSLVFYSCVPVSLFSLFHLSFSCLCSGHSRQGFPGGFQLVCNGGSGIYMASLAVCISLNDGQKHRSRNCQIATKLTSETQKKNQPLKCHNDV